MRWKSCSEKEGEIENARKLEQGGRERRWHCRKKERHKINLRKGTVEKTLVE